MENKNGTRGKSILIHTFQTQPCFKQNSSIFNVNSKFIPVIPTYSSILHSKFLLLSQQSYISLKIFFTQSSFSPEFELFPYLLYFSIFVIFSRDTHFSSLADKFCKSRYYVLTALVS